MYIPEPQEPELMYKLFEEATPRSMAMMDEVLLSMDEVLSYYREFNTSRI